MWIEDDPQSLGKPCGFTHSSHSLDDYLAKKHQGKSEDGDTSATPHQYKGHEMRQNVSGI